MSQNSSLGSDLIAQELRVNQLTETAAIVGGIYIMGYEDALVITNDLWKKQAGGIPQHCFLLASAIETGTAPDPDDEEVILLRVVGPAVLPSETELIYVRAQAMEEMVTAGNTQGAMSSPQIIDVLTRNRIQFSALKAKVLGTFFEKQIGNQTILSFGSDIETYYASSRYKIYKPFGKSLEIIASYPEITEEEEIERQEKNIAPKRVRIGTVRYSSTTRRRTAAENSEQNVAVPVAVKVEDFISMKTAVFGMTRLGKSNTMKTIATSVFQHGMETKQKIGQLLFDPAGEYANVNQQDRTALSQLGTDYVTIFRYGVDGSTPGIRALSTDFFAEKTLPETWSIISDYLNANKNADYVKSFTAADVIGPAKFEDDESLYRRARRRRAVFYGCLIKANFQSSIDFQTTFAANVKVVAAVNQNKRSSDVADFTTSNGEMTLNRKRLIEWCDALVAARADIKTADKDWIDSEMEAILNMYSGAKGSGCALLDPLRVYHGLGRDTDYTKDIYDELTLGKIVIVDLSLGSESILKYFSERIISHIIAMGSERFSSGKDALKIQIFLEEAHRLFNRDNMKIKAESDPYVRLAKEAAKYKIGLIYATQEVSSVDPLILSNTSNWIVTHLNNHSEVRELSKYYEFEDFSDITLRAEDVGFARVKTRSGRYIIPTQIDKFDAKLIEAARDAANRAKEKR